MFILKIFLPRIATMFTLIHGRRDNSKQANLICCHTSFHWGGRADTQRKWTYSFLVVFHRLLAFGNKCREVFKRTKWLVTIAYLPFHNIKRPDVSGWDGMRCRCSFRLPSRTLFCFPKKQKGRYAVLLTILLCFLPLAREAPIKVTFSRTA